MRALALLAALVAALVVPGGPPGVGLVVVGLLVAATAATTAHRSADLVLFGAPALALAAFPAVLDARWVVIPDLLAAWMLATLALVGPRLLAPLAPVVALTDLPGLVPESSARALPVVRAAVFGTAVAIPFATLFLTADAAFAAMADGVPRPSPEALSGRAAAFVLVLLAALGLALGARKRLRKRGTGGRARLSPVEWALPLVLLDGLFLLFVAVQAAVLFGGNDYVLETAGLTYSEYAREGFWQLIAAAALTLVVVKGATLLAGRETRAQRLLLHVLLGTLCALTIVIVGSALYRLHLYEAAFGLTRLRLAAEGFSVWLGGTFAILLLLGGTRRSRSMLRVVPTWTAVALIGFSLANPDARIADRNLDRWRETGRLDVEYLATLSADATPELMRLPAVLRDRALAEVAVRLAEEEPPTSANLSRARARRHLRRAVAASATPDLP